MQLGRCDLVLRYRSVYWYYKIIRILYLHCDKSLAALTGREHMPLFKPTCVLRKPFPVQDVQFRFQIYRVLHVCSSSSNTIHRMHRELEHSFSKLLNVSISQHLLKSESSLSLLMLKCLIREQPFKKPSKITPAQPDARYNYSLNEFSCQSPNIYNLSLHSTYLCTIYDHENRLFHAMFELIGVLFGFLSLKCTHLCQFV